MSDKINKAITTLRDYKDYFAYELGWYFKVGWEFKGFVPSGGHGFCHEYKHTETGEIRYTYSTE